MKRSPNKGSPKQRVEAHLATPDQSINNIHVNVNVIHVINMIATQCDQSLDSQHETVLLEHLCRTTRWPAVAICRMVTRSNGVRILYPPGLASTQFFLGNSQRPTNSEEWYLKGPPPKVLCSALLYPDGRGKFAARACAPPTDAWNSVISVRQGTERSREEFVVQDGLQGVLS